MNLYNISGKHPCKPFIFRCRMCFYCSLPHLRVSTLCVGTLKGSSGEIDEMLEQRCVDVCYIQEVRWREASTRFFTSKEYKYRIFWVSNSEGCLWYGHVIHIDEGNLPFLPSKACNDHFHSDVMQVIVTNSSLNCHIEFANIVILSLRF